MDLCQFHSFYPKKKFYSQADKKYLLQQIEAQHLKIYHLVLLYSDSTSIHT